MTLLLIYRLSFWASFWLAVTTMYQEYPTRPAILEDTLIQLSSRYNFPIITEVQILTLTHFPVSNTSSLRTDCVLSDYNICPTPCTEIINIINVTCERL